MCDNALDQLVLDIGIGDLKDEYRRFVSADICSEGPIRYPRLRSQGRKPSDLCNSINNPYWIAENLKDETRVTEIKELKVEMDRLEEVWQNAYDRRNPIPISKFKTEE